MREVLREPDQSIVYKTVGDVSLNVDVFVPSGHNVLWNERRTGSCASG